MACADSYTVLDEIRQSLKTVTNMSYQQYLENNQGQNEYYSMIQTSHGPPRSYEKIIQKLESDVRDHFRVQEQLRIHAENIEDKIEMAQRKNKAQSKELNNEVKRITLSNNNYEEQLVQTTNQIQVRKQEIELQNLLIRDLEEKVRDLSKKLSKAVMAKLNRSQISKSSSVTGSPRSPISKISGSGFTLHNTTTPNIQPSTSFISDEQKLDKRGAGTQSFEKKSLDLEQLIINDLTRKVHIGGSSASQNSRQASPFDTSVHNITTEIGRKSQSLASRKDKSRKTSEVEQVKFKEQMKEGDPNRLTKRTFQRPSDSFYLKLLNNTSKQKAQKTRKNSHYIANQPSPKYKQRPQTMRHSIQFKSFSSYKQASLKLEVNKSYQQEAKRLPPKTPCLNRSKSNQMKLSPKKLSHSFAFAKNSSIGEISPRKSSREDLMRSFGSLRLSPHRKSSSIQKNQPTIKQNQLSQNPKVVSDKSKRYHPSIFTSKNRDSFKFGISSARGPVSATKGHKF